MENQNPLTPVGKESPYLISLHSKVPASFKKKLTEEALSRGMSLSEYACCLLISAHEQEEKKSSELKNVLQEKELLRKKVQELQEDLAWLGEAGKKDLQKLRRNKEILLDLHSRQVTVTRSLLEHAGFDMYYATNTTFKSGKPYHHVFGMCYSVIGEAVTIEIA